MSPNEWVAQHECWRSGEYIHDGGGSTIIGEKNLGCLGELGQRTDCSTCQMVKQLLVSKYKLEHPMHKGDLPDSWECFYEHFVDFHQLRLGEVTYPCLQLSHLIPI